MKLPWERFEEVCREILDLSRTPGSGNQWHDKGDGTTRDVYDPWPLQIDAKTTADSSFRINHNHFKKWIADAEMSGRRFVMPVRFLKNRQRDDLDFAVLTFDDFAELLDVARQNEEREQSRGEGREQSKKRENKREKEEKKEFLFSHEEVELIKDISSSPVLNDRMKAMFDSIISKMEHPT